MIITDIDDGIIRDEAFPVADINRVAEEVKSKILELVIVVGKVCTVA